jgi:hypothetical protein
MVLFCQKTARISLKEFPNPLCPDVLLLPVPQLHDSKTLAQGR